MQDDSEQVEKNNRKKTTNQQQITTFQNFCARFNQETMKQIVDS